MDRQLPVRHSNLNGPIIPFYWGRNYPPSILPQVSVLFGALAIMHFSLQLSFKKLGEEFYKDVPKGCLVLDVGRGEEKKRCVIPVVYINHPLFEKLLKKAEEEYGFQQIGRIAIPCHLSDFQCVQEVIYRERYESHHLS
ncbi:hypothetical protein SUGI_1168700 [Cryptomeria japonica]|nr:hypothetical protein SUGI_1168700 [Cryptomeria japonica]